MVTFVTACGAGQETQKSCHDPYQCTGEFPAQFAPVLSLLLTIFIGLVDGS